MSEKRRRQARLLVIGALYYRSPLAGTDLWHLTGLRSGRLYPVLDRLETAGLIVGEFEQERADARPRRRYYRLARNG